MTDFLLELLSEEIPARMQAKARNELSRMFAECTSEAGLTTGAIDTFSTPRRLVLIARDVAQTTPDSREEIKGPRTSAPPQALEGFLRKTGLTRGQLEERDGVYFAAIERQGRAAADVLGETIKRIVAEFPWPKSMRCGARSLRWVRPLHGIVAILGENIVPVEIDGISSGATTVGHRFHHPGPITIGGAADYVEKLRACHVIVDQEERERLIREGAASAASAAGLSVLADEGLVVENAGLTECPVPLLGRFDPEFLDVPREVIVLTMRTNQKYFACTNDEGLLAPAFVCVANIAANDGGEAIAKGNARVLAARLADARFFWEQDLKVPLEEQAKKLSGILFHEKLGTIAERSQRFTSLVEAMGRYFDVDPANARRAAALAKADLVTGMVGEFPELQGIVGGYLAEAQGEPAATSEAIRTHYKPAGQADDVPSEPASIAVSLAEKLDTLVGFFGIGQPPTGSKDPFALRRAALSAIRLITENGLRIRLLELFPAAAQFYRNDGHGVADASAQLMDFFADRLKVQQRDAGVRHDLIDAVFALGGEDDLVRLLARVNALQNFVETEEGADLLTAYKRAANILKKENWTGPQIMSSRAEQGIPQTGEEDPLVLVEEPGLKEAVAEMASGHTGSDLPEEKALIDALDAAEPRASAAVEREDFTGAMAALASLRGPIDAFFDHVTVNDPDAAKRERRLNLLMRFRDAVNCVADFSQIEG
ncbi:MAG TPA: glycine--tRNA ligase subunit beta [Sphingomicrobium sp.]|nr:glycine--tRNA ligase subunit beta [Sphingomicrobium sp.]